ncbi:MAG: hypothetical protein R3C27_09945 [Hyphomonadaceae bacterium]
MFVLLWAARLALRETTSSALQSPFVIAFSLGPVLWSAVRLADYPPFLSTYPLHILLAASFAFYVAAVAGRRSGWIMPLRVAVVVIHLVQLTWVALLAGAS